MCTAKPADLELLREKVLRYNSSTQIHQYIVFPRKVWANSLQQSSREFFFKLIGDAWKATPPISSSPGDPILVGKQVQHRFSENKEIVLYTGTVVSQVPGFQDWYNIVYDDEPDIVYSYKLMEDYINGDLSIIIG